MFQKVKRYDPFVQIAAMRSRFPQFRVRKKGYLDIEFVGELLVRPGLPVYRVWIHYLGDIEPPVRILSPVLVEKPPHFYHSSNRLCLFKPSDYTWTRRKLIATDIVPWTAAWIYFYEKWLKTGIWHGPEASHSTVDFIK